MKFFFLLQIILAFFQMKAEASLSQKNSIKYPGLETSKQDIAIGEQIINLLKLIDKGYINQEFLNKLSSEVAKTKHFQNFEPWLKTIYEISSLTKADDLIHICNRYLDQKETLPLERMMEKSAGNYCRERALQFIRRDIDKNKSLSENAMQFLQVQLKFYLSKKNKKDFAYFIQSLSDYPDILKKLSDEITTYSVRNQIVPSADVLKDLVINEQITHLIQAKGFNPLHHKNVFYAEFSKLIDTNYRILESNPEEEVIHKHFIFMKNFLELNIDHLPLGLCLGRLNDFSKNVFRKGFKDTSRIIFKYIIKKNISDTKDDAMFFYLWTYIYKNHFEDVLKIANEYDLLKKDFVTDARLLFWIAMAYEATKKPKDAAYFFETIINKHPLSYYAIMATKKLQLLKSESTSTRFFVTEAAKESPPPFLNLSEFDNDHISSLVRLRVWSKIDSSKMLRLELKRLYRNSMPSFLVKHPTERQFDVRSKLHLLNASLIFEEKNYLAAFKYLYTAIDNKEVKFDRDLLEILYPTPFLDDISKNLKNDSLDPIILISLIRQESVFNPHARSPVGARGLMQLMPTTAKRIKRSVREKHLTDPAVNIEIGIKYFKMLMKKYDGNLVYVLAAYNAGETRVSRWKEQYFETDESIVKNIEAIPFLETRNYVKLIFRNIFFYKLLLGGSEFRDPEELNKIFNITLGFQR